MSMRPPFVQLSIDCLCLLFTPVQLHPIAIRDNVMKFAREFSLPSEKNVRRVYILAFWTELEQYIQTVFIQVSFHQ